MRPRSRILPRGILTGLLAVGLTVGVPAASLAAGDAGDAGDGDLELNADVLVNDSIGAGTAGDFAIRGRLFLDDISARASKQSAASAALLNVVGALTFEPPVVVADEYETMRAALFDGYSTEALSHAPDAPDESPVPYGFVLLAGVPFVLIAGAWLGRLWTARKRAAA